ncbi:hypothetical protein LCGC14_3021250 [marine sediment metagenome]|uniref:DUF1643 domain-containing protein n=1 Tax=marine sediment metagenome TaxID=412755 RepID=A0A0F8Z2R7_9ZZZZ
MNIGEGISGALFSDENRRFRYALWRIWQPDGDKLLFIGLNPSTANDVKDDPTIRRLIRFAKSWGFGGLFAGNLFSLVTADPAVLWFSSSKEEVNGPNDIALKQMSGLSRKVMVGWGNQGIYAGTRPEEVLALIGQPVFCIKRTKEGQPFHPLYMPLSSQLVPYVRE